MSAKLQPLDKLKLLATQMHLEAAEEVHRNQAPANAPDCYAPQKPASAYQAAKANMLGVTNAVVSGGKTVPLLKTMMTTACERDCHYCPFRAGRSFRRVTFKPDEMAESFMKLHKQQKVEGLFLSSGIIKGSARAQDKMLDTADILRQKHQFRGYIHLKVMPGVEKDQLRKAMQVADRLSVNLEAPNAGRLPSLAPMKVFTDELLQPLKWIEELREEDPRLRRVSTATQFVVGPAGETDVELLTTAQLLTHHAKLRRVYFSAFSPIRDTPLENAAPENPWREHRLYQSSFLIRDYGFDVEELPFAQSGKLPLEVDPKLAWARVNLANAPVELNRATQQQLLRVPGLGPKNAQKILNARRRGTLRELRDLQNIGIATKRLKDFVLLDGRAPVRQMSLF